MEKGLETLRSARGTTKEIGKNVGDFSIEQKVIKGIKESYFTY